MLKINNPGPLEVQLVPSTDKHGQSYAVVVLKGTFDLKAGSSALALAKEQMPILQADEFYGEPDASSIKYESDLAPRKLATDLVLIGDAVAPNEKPMRALDVTLSVNEMGLSARVFGKRVWEKQWANWEISQPEGFVRMPLCFENAFGGCLAEKKPDDPSFIYAANPMGKGFVPHKQEDLADGAELPNIEDPRALVQTPEDRPSPVGFGFLGRSWQPRISHTGTYDEQWTKHRMPMLPLDFNEQYYNGAHPGLTFPMLSGGEQISITNVSPAGPLAFLLPKLKVAVKITIKGQSKDYLARLDTVVIEPNDERVQLTWRVSAPCHRQFLYVNAVDVQPLEWL